MEDRNGCKVFVSVTKQAGQETPADFATSVGGTSSSQNMSSFCASPPSVAQAQYELIAIETPPMLHFELNLITALTSPLDDLRSQVRLKAAFPASRHASARYCESQPSCTKSKEVSIKILFSSASVTKLNHSMASSSFFLADLSWAPTSQPLD